MGASSSREPDPRSQLPSVDQLLQLDGMTQLVDGYGRELVLEQLRQLLAEARRRAADRDASGMRGLLDAPVEALSRRLSHAAQPSLVRVINASGVVIHTNLGRAPLAPQVAARVATLGSTYSNLEYDLDAGERGNREVHAEARLRQILGAEATAVVNNNAAAVLLAVNTLAEGREVIVSRGELVEIGGSFRIPDVLAKSGARLREVGTTNRTRLSDYGGALGPETGAILRVHKSNFEIVGFTQAPSLSGLAELAHERGVPLIEDLGSGLLTPQTGPLAGEPTVAEALAAGVAVVTWSGDKLLGGPQAGLVAGGEAAVRDMRRNPLYRALRVDKMTLSALDAVLVEYQCGRAQQTVPVQRMIRLAPETIRSRALGLAERLRRECPELQVELSDGASAVGGGAAPSRELPTTLLRLALPSLSAARLAAKLRAARPPVISRIAGDRVLLDLRTVFPEDDPALAGAILSASPDRGLPERGRAQTS